MTTDVENHIRQNHPWQKLPANVKQSLGNSQREYEKAIVSFSVKNQLRYKGNIVKTVRKDERRYYEDLMQYSREHLMLYPYHLPDVIVKGLRITSFMYYINMMQDIMMQEKSYDSLPNFTAADCLRLLGIGRNQYIDLMNQCRSTKKFFRKRPVKELLPSQPIEDVSIEPWWIANIGYITEDDVKLCTGTEKVMVDSIIDTGPHVAGELDKTTLHGLYRKGLVYMDVPIADEDCIIVPPLEGFVMNRVLGDYFETLLYKIFVSIDENTAVAELANVLQIDLLLVKNAVSMYCRLGFARKKNVDAASLDYHPSWSVVESPTLGSSKPHVQEHLLLDLNNAMNVELTASDPGDLLSSTNNMNNSSDVVASLEHAIDVGSQNVGKRIAFMFDSTLTAFLMMGNLSPGLKSHAVTMFEVGKLSDESMDSFLSELEKVGSDAEGEARRYFDHALTLRDTIRFLRHNKSLCENTEAVAGHGIDLLRCESLLSLDPETRSRVLNKNYSLLVSMAPLSNEIRPVSSSVPEHIGPAIPEVSSLWFKLYLYQLTGCGPPSLLLVKGTKLKRLPHIFQGYERLLVTTWGHDPGVIASSNILLTLNDALAHSAVFVQGHGHFTEGTTVHVSFPLDKKENESFGRGDWQCHSAVQSLARELDMTHSCGFVSLLNPHQAPATDDDGEPISPPRQRQSSSSGAPPSAALSEVPSAEDVSGNPANGIKDKVSADMLASELDALDEQSPGKKRDKMSLDLNQQPEVVAAAEQGEPGVVRKESDWHLLDLCFGIPLFQPQLNKDVCGKIVSLGLFHEESLQELLQSSRTLSLKLLDFIMEWQVTSAVTEVETHGLPPSKEEHCTLYPTLNVAFSNGKLHKWTSL